MEILSAGSFINFENQEKIEQLKFTAAELAKAALETTGFVNTEEAGKNLGLEFWQGLEYMCRETEEAALKNIFLTHFLDHLRESRPGLAEAAIELPQESGIIVSVPIENEETPEDEFLGLMEMTPVEENLIEESDDEIDEAQENMTHTEEISTSEADFENTVEVKTTVNNQGEKFEEPESPTIVAEVKIEQLPDNAVKAKTATSNLAVAEKEPYQWGKCTVTATIQLLPILDGVIGRKAVLSVRTHDFAPLISLVELAGNDLTGEFALELEKVMEKYKNDLPVKVMDKLKKEKLTAKKSVPKTTSESKSVSAGIAKPKESGTNQTTTPKADQTVAPVVSQPAQTGQQGNLFGF